MQAQLEIVLTGRPLDQVDSALDRFWSLHPEIPAAVAQQVAIAVGEIAANVVEHGDARRMWLTLHVARTQVHVIVSDDGSPVDIDLSSVTMPGPLADRGRGLAMAMACLGLLSYHRDRCGNHWRLVSRQFAATA